jgi:hypothetical protein
MDSEKEKCVMCGTHTRYNISDHIDTRYGYIEGVGQLCPPCYQGSSRSHLLVDYRIILDTPNDMELGKKVRSAYFGETGMNKFIPFEKISIDR